MNARLLSLVSKLYKHNDVPYRKMIRGVERRHLLDLYKKLKKVIVSEAKGGKYCWGIRHTIAESYGDPILEFRGEQLEIILRLFRYKHRDFTVDINLSSDVSIFRHLITWGETAKTIKISENR